MHAEFWNYYPPSPDELKALWDSAVLVPDTNILLALYRVSTETRQEVLAAIDRFDGRLFLPHQVGQEFFRNRLNVIAEETAIYRRIVECLDSAAATAYKTLHAVRKDAVVNTSKITSIVQGAVDTAKAEIQSLENAHPIRLPEALRGDDILLRLTALFDGKVGKPYSATELDDIRAMAKERYESEIPPGYRDTDKPDHGVGDYILWRQILDRASESKDAVLFITEDNKGDWFQRAHGFTVGPRPELLAEFRNATGMPIHVYTLRSFLSHAGEYQASTVSDEAIAEVESLAEKSAMRENHLPRGQVLRQRTQQLANVLDEIDDEIAQHRRRLTEAKWAPSHVRFENTRSVSGRAISDNYELLQGDITDEERAKIEAQLDDLLFKYFDGANNEYHAIEHGPPALHTVRDRLIFLEHRRELIAKRLARAETEEARLSGALDATLTDRISEDASRDKIALSGEVNAGIRPQVT